MIECSIKYMDFIYLKKKHILVILWNVLKVGIHQILTLYDITGKKKRKKSNFNQRLLSFDDNINIT